MKTSTHDGTLVLADISGFTAFVTATELEHGPQIIAALLEAVMRRLSPPLDIQEVEGDAVFAVGPDGALQPRVQLLDVLDEAFVAFKALQRELADDQSCGCHACRSVDSLDLKIVAHHGRFLRQRVGAHSQCLIGIGFASLNSSGTTPSSSDQIARAPRWSLAAIRACTATKRSVATCDEARMPPSPPWASIV